MHFRRDPAESISAKRDIWEMSIRAIIDDYPYTAMDTEFLGIILLLIGNLKSSFNYNYGINSERPKKKKERKNRNWLPCFYSFFFFFLIYIYIYITLVMSKKK